MREASEHKHRRLVQWEGVVTELDDQVMLLAKISPLHEILFHLVIVLRVEGLKVKPDLLGRVFNQEIILSLNSTPFVRESQVN